MTQAIQNQIDKISAECSSIYSKEDVIKILTNLKSNPQEDSSLDEFLNKLVDRFEEKLDSIDWDDIVDRDSAEFRIESINELVLDYIRVKESNIRDLLKESITETKQS